MLLETLCVVRVRKSLLDKLHYISAFHLPCKEQTQVPQEVMYVMGTGRAQHPGPTLDNSYNLLSS